MKMILKCHMCASENVSFIQDYAGVHFKCNDCGAAWTEYV